MNRPRQLLAVEMLVSAHCRADLLDPQETDHEEEAEKLKIALQAARPLETTEVEDARSDGFLAPIVDRLKRGEAPG